MTLQRIERSRWSGFCEILSTEVLGKRAVIEVASQELGVQTEGRGLPVIGFTYDRRNDIFEITLDGLDHMIVHPLELYAEYGSCGVESLAIVDTDTWRIVVLRDPLMLPDPNRLRS
jgi:hypothetical protein